MIQFQRPQDVERDLAESFGDLNEAAKEAFLVQSYREGLLSVGRIAEILGKGVLETQEWLAERGAPLNYDQKDLAEDTKTLSDLFPDAGL